MKRNLKLVKADAKITKRFIYYLCKTSKRAEECQNYETLYIIYVKQANVSARRERMNEMLLV